MGWKIVKIAAVVIATFVTGIFCKDHNPSDLEGTVEVHLPGPPTSPGGIIQTHPVKGFSVIPVEIPGMTIKPYVVASLTPDPKLGMTSSHL